MPKRIVFTSTLPEVMRRPMYELMLIGWVSGRMSLGSAMTCKQAIIDFMSFYQIPEEMWDVETAQHFFYRNSGIIDTAKYNNIK